jgi:pilus assembly protein Flp/PilA
VRDEFENNGFSTKRSNALKNVRSQVRRFLMSFLRKLGRHVKKFVRNDDGPTAVEYAVMLALIIVVCVGAVLALGQNSSSTFGGVGSTLGQANANAQK